MKGDSSLFLFQIAHSMLYYGHIMKEDRTTGSGNTPFDAQNFLEGLAGIGDIDRLALFLVDVPDGSLTEVLRGLNDNQSLMASLTQSFDGDSVAIKMLRDRYGAIRRDDQYAREFSALTHMRIHFDKEISRWSAIPAHDAEAEKPQDLELIAALHDIQVGLDRERLLHRVATSRASFIAYPRKSDADILREAGGIVEKDDATGVFSQELTRGLAQVDGQRRDTWTGLIADIGTIGGVHPNVLSRIFLTPDALGDMKGHQLHIERTWAQAMVQVRAELTDFAEPEDPAFRAWIDGDHSIVAKAADAGGRLSAADRIPFGSLLMSTPDYEGAKEALDALKRKVKEATLVALFGDRPTMSKSA